MSIPMDEETNSYSSPLRPANGAHGSGHDTAEHQEPGSPTDSAAGTEPNGGKAFSSYIYIQCPNNSSYIHLYNAVTI